MYIPPTFREDDISVTWDLLEEIRLGSLMTTGERPMVSHLPFMVDRQRGEKGVLVGHMARNNLQWSEMEQHAEVLTTFIGPNSYISPSWYGTSPRAPTWNFVAIHVHGTSRLIHDVEKLKSMVLRLSTVMEPPESDWKAGNLDPAYVERLVPAIVGFEIEVTAVETQLRLSQQNNLDDRRRVHRALGEGGLRQRQVAELMERYSFRDI